MRVPFSGSSAALTIAFATTSPGISRYLRAMPKALTAPSSAPPNFSPTRACGRPPSKTRAQDADPLEGELLHVAIELTFDARVEDARARIRRRRRDEHVAGDGVARRRLGEGELVVEVDLLLSGQAAGLLPRRPQRRERHVALDERRPRIRRVEIDDVVFQLRVRLPRLPAAEGDHLAEPPVVQQLTQELRPDQPGRPDHERGIHAGSIPVSKTNGGRQSPTVAGR